jgi:hypothetical protein
MFTREQKRSAYKKLPVEVQDFIMSNETTELITNYLNGAGLTEEQSILADSEILFAMFGLQTLTDAINNIAKTNNKQIENFLKLKDDLEKNIFREIDGYKNTSTSTPNETQEIKKGIRESKSDKLRENTPDQVKVLPKAAQDFIFGGIWEERTEEIANKYSLDEKQTENLISSVFFVLINQIKIEDCLETIITDLKISRLLAEQIVEDLEVRVFEYALKSIEKKEEVELKSKNQIPDQIQNLNNVEKTKRTNAAPPDQTVIQKTISVAEIDIPEVRPEITPMIEEGEKVQIRPIANIKETATTELIQRPMDVPRFTGVPIEKEEKIKPKEIIPEPPKKYAVDPYREPIE